MRVPFTIQEAEEDGKMAIMQMCPACPGGLMYDYDDAHDAPKCAQCGFIGKNGPPQNPYIRKAAKPPTYPIGGPAFRNRLDGTIVPVRGYHNISDVVYQLLGQVDWPTEEKWLDENSDNWEGGFLDNTGTKFLTREEAADLTRIRCPVEGGAYAQALPGWVSEHGVYDPTLGRWDAPPRDDPFWKPRKVQASEDCASCEEGNHQRCDSDSCDCARNNHGRGARKIAIREFDETDANGFVSAALEWISSGQGPQYDYHMYENAAEFGFTPSWQLQAHLDQNIIFIVQSVDGDPEIVYSAPAEDFDLPTATQALLAAVQRATPYIREEGFDTEAAVNIVDEAEISSPQGHEELSEPSTYPGGEQPGKTKLFPEIDHGVMRRMEGAIRCCTRVFFRRFSRLYTRRPDLLLRRRASEKPTEPQKCEECDNPAVKSIIWAEGMAYVPVCEDHLDEMVKHITKEYDSPPDAIRDVKQKKKADLESIVHQAIGEASMCWDPLPSSQVFDATAAHEIAIKLIDAITKRADELHTGTFIGLKVPPEIAEKIAVEGGEPPGDMHITLWYSKGLTAEQIQKVEEIFKHFWSENPSLHVELTGVDAFEPSESSDGLKPIYAVVDSPDIMALQKFFVETLAESGIKSDSEHAAKYIPHVTLKYEQSGKGINKYLPEAIEFEIEDYVFSPGVPVDEKSEAPDEKEAEIGFSLFDLTKNSALELSAGKLISTGFRSNYTGEVLNSGPFHDMNVILDKYPDDDPEEWTQGFISDQGEFLDRYEAAQYVNHTGPDKRLYSEDGSSELRPNFPYDHDLGVDKAYKRYEDRIRDRKAQDIKLDDYRRLDDAYRDQNQSEDPDLHLGSKEGSASPIRAAAFRNPITGQVIESGAFHDQSVIPGGFSVDDQGVRWEDGFVTREGRFVTREEAARLVNMKPRFRPEEYGGDEINTLHSEFPESGLQSKPHAEADVEAPYTTMGLPNGEMFDKDHEMNIKMHASVGQGSDPYRVGRLLSFEELSDQHQAEVDLNWQDKQKNPTGRHFMWIRTFMPVATIIEESKKWYDKNRNRKWGQKDQRKVIALAERMEGGAVVTPLLVSPPGEKNGGLWEGYHRLRAHDLLAYQRAPVLMKVDISDPDWKMKLAQAMEGEEEREPWFCVDLDGTILEEDPNAHHRDNERPPLGEPFPDAARVMGELSAMGRVSIYTARQYFEDDNDEGWKQEISEHLKFHNIPFDDIYVGKKPPADAFIDNKAVNFDGDWSRIRTLVQEVMNRGKQAEQPPQQVSVDDTISMEAAVEKEEFAQGLGNGDNASDQYTDVDESREDRTITRSPAFENLV